MVKKPRPFTPTQLANRLQVLNLYSIYLPPAAGAVQVMPERKLCTHLFRMMPIAFQRTYKASGQMLSGTSLLQLSDYFDIIASMETDSNHSRSKTQNSGGKRNQRDQDTTPRKKRFHKETHDNKQDQSRKNGCPRIKFVTCIRGAITSIRIAPRTQRAPIIAIRNT